MNRALVLLVAVNVLVIAFGGLFAYSDLYLREYDTRWHLNTKVIAVEYGPLAYRPTYEYYDITPQKTVITHGSLTLDFFQLSILIMAIADVVWIYSKRKEIEQTAVLA